MLELGDLEKRVVIQALRDWASKKEDIEAVYLYGSFARGKANPNDLDVAIKSRQLPESADPDTCFIAEADNWQKEIARLLRIEPKELHLYNTDYIGDEAIRVFP